MLQALMSYAESHLPDSEPGFKTREVRWRIELDADGAFLAVVPLGDGKRGQSVARCPDMHGMNAGGKAHFLIETAQTAALLFKANEDEKKIASGGERHRFFASHLLEAAKTAEVLKPLASFLTDPGRVTAARNALLSHKAKGSDWISWRIADTDPLADPAVLAWWRNWRRADIEGPDAGGDSTPSDARSVLAKMVCLLSGEATTPLATHPKITGLSGVGGLAMGDVMVGFDKAAFGSYELDQSSNAAMSAEAVQKYVDGLNDLIRSHSRKQANALVLHWFKEQIPAEDDPLFFLMGFETEEQTETAALVAAQRLLGAIQAGSRPDLANNRYYALTISGAAGRVMTRDWMEGGFASLTRHIHAWLDDLSIVARDGAGLARDPKFMAVCGALVRELKDLPAPTATTLWNVALQNLPIPQPMMAQALARFRSDLVDKDQPPFNHARMGLIKAYFIRGGDQHMTPYLNPEHPAPAYHCGRLLAVLSSLQRAALGDVGAGVVQRYYAAASQTPGLVIGRLTANARNHLGKLEGGLAWWYEEKIAEVMGQLDDGAPRILDLEGQGLFALGYYQQLANLRTNKKTTADVINEPGA